MRVRVVGCSGSFSGPRSAASCYLVEHREGERTWRIVLDLGSGALGQLQNYCDPTEVDAYVISHLHPDHCIDLCGLYVMHTYDPHQPHPERIDVHGPADLAAHIDRAYGVHDGGTLRTAMDFHPVTDGHTTRIGPFELLWRRVNHPGDAYGVRVTAGGHTLAFTGDTDDTPALDELLRDAHLVLADAAFVEGRDSAEGIHLTGRRAAQAALRAGGVRELVLTHIPPWNDQGAAMGEARGIWTGPLHLAMPGLMLDLEEVDGEPCPTTRAVSV
ncbi:Ribonuclease BN, tRNA processing enzyme [Kytococcus aerolatus]|uniref:Ribonuclease BN, tRNA processing enzyme n=1 Tax=Kytococcus aerolatus TaxID=592308 RepID=A0A212U0Z4_9MICO|nr:MBL fold metallo-hydrolase [Kytococcus aerolatus]SNC71908.1 Ribonuclease BN, tRNA processing enzyme [Kytococcus aerolatus]